ncbi:hypothetical protein HHK36_016955 [Tetracentron sinense]|uniref:MATH domain-containing protein n=1 Tax=Tetracentron sinense TaxID=13715 RepID=A0A835DF71_TETSI|nr:hypothetical protein HHK36_016955 [Tetracentron sinense]
MTNKIGKPSTSRVSFSHSQSEVLNRPQFCISVAAMLTFLRFRFNQHASFYRIRPLIHDLFSSRNMIGCWFRIRISPRFLNQWKVAQAETASTVENQLVEDPLFSRFTWTIKEFSRLKSKKHYSETFLVDGCKWRVLIFPKGNNVDHLSIYLDVVDSENLPYGWSRFAQFRLAVVSQILNEYTVRKYTQHRFYARNSCCGFTLFMPLSELYDPGRGYLVNDTCIVQAKVAVRRAMNDTEGIFREPLIVNDEEAMAVKPEPEVEAIISAEGITEELAITNVEEATVVEIQNVDREAMYTEVLIPESDSTPTVFSGTAPQASVMVLIAPAKASSEMPSNDQISETEVTTEAILVEENQIDNSVELPTDKEPIQPSLSTTPSTVPGAITPMAVPPPYSPSPSPSPSSSMGPPASSLALLSPVRMHTEELDSIVNKYPIPEAHQSTWRDIVKKYGDITHKSNIKNLKMKAVCIETVCDIISVLKDTPAQGLKMSSINQCESDLEDVESTKMDVSWLKERLHMLKVILAQSIQFSVMVESFNVETNRLAKLTVSIAEDNSRIEDTRKEIAKQEALLMEYQESLKAKNEEFKAVQHAITSQHEEFVCLRTAAEKLLYYGTKGFTLDLLGRSSPLSSDFSAISSSSPIMTNKIGRPSTARVSFSLSEQENGEMLHPHSDFTEVPQPMEAQTESATTVENQLIEDPSLSSFRTEIKEYYFRRVLIFPKGDNGDHFLMCLNVADSANLVPDKWSRWAQFSLAVINQIHDKYTVRKYTQHQFNTQNGDWGFTLFMPLSELYDPARGYLVNDTCIVQAKVAVRRVVNNTMDIIWEPLIVNDEETMAVKMEPEVKEMISAEGITQDPAITNEEPFSRSPRTSMGSPASSLVPVSPLRMNTEELDSIANKYPISEAHKSTWRDIVKKYGDITHKSNVKNLKLKAAYIETICDIISGLKGTTANELKITSINQCESDLEDVESTKIDVSWLKERLHMVKTLVAQSIQVSVVGDSFMVKTETLAKLTASIAGGNSKIEDTRKEIAKYEALIMEYQESVKAKNEEFKAVQHAITIQHEEFDRLRNSCTMALKDLP